MSIYIIAHQNFSARFRHNFINVFLSEYLCLFDKYKVGFFYLKNLLLSTNQVAEIERIKQSNNKRHNTTFVT